MNRDVQESFADSLIELFVLGGEEVDDSGAGLVGFAQPFQLLTCFVKLFLERGDTFS